MLIIRTNKSKDGEVKLAVAWGKGWGRPHPRRRGLQMAAPYGHHVHRQLLSITPPTAATIVYSAFRWIATVVEAKPKINTAEIFNRLKSL